MKKVLGFLLATAASVACALAQDAPQPDADLLGCLKLPAIDPQKDFLGNFNNSCYALTLVSSRGGDHAGDLNALYGLAFYKVTPGYELVLAGTFPHARFFSVTVYDSHLAETSGAVDNAIRPLNGSTVNPFLLNTPFVPNQQYGMTIGFGGQIPASPSPGCSTSDTTIDENFLDASQIHQGLSWNGAPGLPPNFPVHLTGANIGGQLIVRSYYDLSDKLAPVVIVRDLSTGCAVPLNDAKNIITTNLHPGGGWYDAQQTSAHDEYSYSIQKNLCFPQDPINQVRWNRSQDYIPGYNTAAAYLAFNLSAAKVQSIISNQQFMLIRFQLPKMPSTPCPNGNCVLTGSEELRYRSISFEYTKKTLASLDDASYVKDPNGNVALVIGFGAKPPAYVTAGNYYTYFDLSSVPNYRQVEAVSMRDILPNMSFQCSNFNVPFLTTEYNPEMGFMGNYVPTVDFVTASQIPQIAVPVNRPNTCAVQVPQTPTVCPGQ